MSMQKWSSHLYSTADFAEQRTWSRSVRVHNVYVFISFLNRYWWPRYDTLLLRCSHYTFISNIYDKINLFVGLMIYNACALDLLNWNLAHVQYCCIQTKWFHWTIRNGMAPSSSGLWYMDQVMIQCLYWTAGLINEWGYIQYVWFYVSTGICTPD